MAFNVKYALSVYDLSLLSKMFTVHACERMQPFSYPCFVMTDQSVSGVVLNNSEDITKSFSVF